MGPGFAGTPSSLRTRSEIAPTGRRDQANFRASEEISFSDISTSPSRAHICCMGAYSCLAFCQRASFQLVAVPQDSCAKNRCSPLARRHALLSETGISISFLLSSSFRDPVCQVAGWHQHDPKTRFGIVWPAPGKTFAKPKDCRDREGGVRPPESSFVVASPATSVDNFCSAAFSSLWLDCCKLLLHVAFLLSQMGTGIHGQAVVLAFLHVPNPDHFFPK